MEIEIKKKMVIVFLDKKVWSWKMGVSDPQDLNSLYFKDHNPNNHTFETHTGTESELYTILDSKTLHPDGLSI